MTPDEERPLWNALLSADMNSRYWAYIARRYERRLKAATIFLAATSTSAVGSLLASLQVDWLPQVLSLVTAVTAVALPILNWEGTIPKRGARRRKVGIPAHCVRAAMGFASRHLECGSFSQV